MSPDLIITIARKTILTAGLLALPVLAVGLIVGLIISILQAVTQIHEMSLTFVPKIIAVGIALYFSLPYMLKTILYYTSHLYLSVNTFIR
ncbi:flagellar biosynthetic protein FliQ [Candidatus Aerophobetes bacterium]|nr:flagellar biosynthetic protein FliQ [Candidatus Aerophobetes bacterium]